MASKRLRKPQAQKPKPTLTVVHDRRAQDVATGARIGTVEVTDPYDSSSKVLVFRNLRDDPLAAMHDARLVDEAQFCAGRHWQRCYDLSELGGARAIDPTKERVDGGGFPDLLSDARCRASDDLAKAARALGQEGGAIVNDVLGSRMTLAGVAHKWGMQLPDEKARLCRKLIWCLDTLAFTFGYASERPAPCL